ncbi:hypothetical protein [Pseudomonas sp. B33.4]|uniref:hypothetical protein n=1 Tax=Pseudomonas sp. B33.4 TaxID=3104265 RepID=UPI002ADEAC6B|nr:hypothetical protein [Pseudomonas sp. B33.4]
MKGDPVDLRSPSQGKELEVTYRNGDRFYLKFISDIQDFECLQGRYSVNLCALREHLSFPLTILEINLEIAGAGITISPSSISLPGFYACNIISIRSGVAIEYSSNLKWRNL